MDDSVPLPVRLAESYKRLAASADALGSKTHQFSKIITELERVLAKLDLNVEAWEKLRGSDEDGRGNFWHEWVGYAKVKGKWCIALSETRGNHHNDPEDSTDLTWCFDEGPRSLQINAIDKLPDLLEALAKTADKTSRKLDQKLDQVREYTEAIQAATADVAKARKAARP
jgi:hypothetical protein